MSAPRSSKSRHAAADAALLDAKSNLQRHHLEAPDDADDKVRVKLEAQAAASIVTRDGFADERAAFAEEATKLFAQADWLDQTIIEIIISEAQNEVATSRSGASKSSRIAP